MNTPEERGVLWCKGWQVTGEGDFRKPTLSLSPFPFLTHGTEYHNS